MCVRMYLCVCLELLICIFAMLVNQCFLFKLLIDVLSQLFSVINVRFICLISINEGWGFDRYSYLLDERDDWVFSVTVKKSNDATRLSPLSNKKIYYHKHHLRYTFYIWRDDSHSLKNIFHILYSHLTGIYVVFFLNILNN